MVSKEKLMETRVKKKNPEIKTVAGPRSLSCCWFIQNLTTSIEFVNFIKPISVRLLVKYNPVVLS